jgi:hypothetical protein
LAAPRVTAINAPRKRALKVSSFMDLEAGTKGTNGFFSIVETSIGGDSTTGVRPFRHRTPEMTMARRVAPLSSLCQFVGEPVSLVF